MTRWHTHTCLFDVCKRLNRAAVKQRSHQDTHNGATVVLAAAAAIHFNLKKTFISLIASLECICYYILVTVAVNDWHWSVLDQCKNVQTGLTFKHRTRTVY